MLKLKINCTMELRTLFVIFLNNNSVNVKIKNDIIYYVINNCFKSMCKMFKPQYSTVQFRTVQYSTVQYSTVQFRTVQYSTVQYSTVQYSAIQDSIV